MTRDERVALRGLRKGRRRLEDIKLPYRYIDVQDRIKSICGELRQLEGNLEDMVKSNKE